MKYVPHTRFTETFGMPQEEVSVEVAPLQLAEAELTLAEVAEAIQRRDAEKPDAKSHSRRLTLPVRLGGDVDRIDDLRNVILRTDGSGHHLRLGSVASISYSERRPPSSVAHFNGMRTAVIACRMDPGADIGRWTSEQDKVLAELNRSLPDGLCIKSVFSQLKYTRQRSWDLYLELTVGMTLVAAVTSVLMGWRAALPICSSMPLSILCTMLLMIPYGIGLHQMSITGLIVALGVLDSNAIIVVDDIERRLAAGVDPVSAIRECLAHLWSPLLCSNSLSILGFAPAYLIPGPTGEFLGQLCWAVNVALATSVAISLGIVPFLAVWCLQRVTHATSRTPRHGFNARDMYRKLLGTALLHPGKTIAASILLPLVGFGVAPMLREQFFPAADRDHFHYSIRLASPASIQETQRTVRRAREIIAKHEEVSDILTVTGTNVPMVHYSMLSMDDRRPYFAQGIVQLKTRRVDPKLIQKIQKELDQALPQAQVLVTWVEQGPPAIAPVELRLYGPSLQQLSASGEEARRILSDVPGIIQTRTSVDPGGPVIGIQVIQRDALSLGFTDDEVAEQLYGQLDGMVRVTMSEDGHELPVSVRLLSADEISPAEALSLPLRPPLLSGQTIPLAAIANWSVLQQPFNIHRRNGIRCNAVYGYVQAGVLPVELEKHYREALRLAQWELPDGYRLDFGGVSQERNAAVGNLRTYSIPIAILMLAILVATFHSFRLSAIIFCVAVMSAGLGLLSLWMCNLPIGLVAIIGIMGMVGIAINDSVMVLEEVRHAWQRRNLVDDVVEAVYAATRHIVATTVTAAVGVSPLIVLGGDFWPPLAIVIVGGVGGATMLALGFTPALFLAIQRRHQITHLLSSAPAQMEVAGRPAPQIERRL